MRLTAAPAESPLERRVRYGVGSVLAIAGGLVGVAQWRAGVLPEPVEALFGDLAAPQPLLRVTAGDGEWWFEHRAGPGAPPVVRRDEMRLPHGQRVILELRSRDVVHGFWVPGLHAPVRLVPGRTVTREVRPRHAGTFQGLCSELCGAPHGAMAFSVVVQPRDEFHTWLDSGVREAR
jgi:cytochrome c oxidase subunit II